MDKRMDEFDLARRTLKWLIEHRAYWDLRTDTLKMATSLKDAPPPAQPSPDILIFLLTLTREIDLEAVSAH